MRTAAFLPLLVLAGCSAPILPPPASVEPLPAMASPRPRPPGGRVTARATFVAVGDVLLHDSVQVGAQEHTMGSLNADGYDHLYEQVSQYLADADLTFANLETPITVKPPRGKGRWLFSAPPVSLDALKRAGVDVVSVANNHAFDQGAAGLAETVSHLEERGLSWVGGGRSREEAWRPRLFGLGSNGALNVAMLGFAELMNEHGNEGAESSPHVAMLDIARAEEAVKRAAKEADAVIVSVHWGIEYETRPRKREVGYAHRLIEAGASVVLGHHPHVLQPIELYTTPTGRTGVIFYSLGNFIANQGAMYGPGDEDDPRNYGRRRDGALVRFAIEKRDYGGGLVQVEVEDVDALPLWTENNLKEAVHAPTILDAKGKPSESLDIHVVALDRALDNVRRDIASLKASLPQPLDAESRAALRALEGEERLYLERKEAIADTLGRGFIRELPLATPPGIARRSASPSP